MIQASAYLVEITSYPKEKFHQNLTILTFLC